MYIGGDIMASKSDLILQAETINAWITLSKAGLHEELLRLMEEARENYKKGSE